MLVRLFSAKASGIASGIVSGIISGTASFTRLTALAALAVQSGSILAAETPALNGEKIFNQHCATCHGNPNVRAPQVSTLLGMSKNSLMFTMTEGKMKQQAVDLTNNQRQAIVDYLGSTQVDPYAWEAAANCKAKNTGIDRASALSPIVSSWGHGINNHRYQSANKAGLSIDDLSNLELAWSVAFPGTNSMRSQPVMTNDTLFVAATRVKAVYAFDLESGCLKWAHHSTTPVRTSLSMGKMPGTDTPIIFYGSARGDVEVLNALDGSVLWTKNIKVSMGSTITGSPVLLDDRLFVPISNFEVGLAANPKYECCKQHGAVKALDIKTGNTLWTYHTMEEATPTGKTNSIGTKLWGPSGAPIWTTPAIDEKRNVLYVGTGENYSLPTSATSDAIIAIDLDTGKEKWVFQALAGDAFNMACNSFMAGGVDGPNCPSTPGPDFDFGASVIITQDKNGRDVLLAGQKSGDIWALDPDNKGAVIWNTEAAGGTPLGGVHWGMTLVDDQLFIAASDPDLPIAGWEYNARPGVVALDVTTGDINWRHTATRGCEFKGDPADRNRKDDAWPDCPFAYGYSAAPTGLDDFVLAGSLKGEMKAFSTKDGSVLWEYDTVRYFETVNGIEGHGGSFDSAGPIVGNGKLVMQSGYGSFRQMPGNVVLVFKTKN